MFCQGNLIVCKRSSWWPPSVPLPFWSFFRTPQLGVFFVCLVHLFGVCKGERSQPMFLEESPYPIVNVSPPHLFALGGSRVDLRARARSGGVWFEINLSRYFVSPQPPRRDCSDLVGTKRNILVSPISAVQLFRSMYLKTATINWPDHKSMDIFGQLPQGPVQLLVEWPGNLRRVCCGPLFLGSTVY